jgi:glycosyltransferase involved in cell wall biosynthesis
MKSKIISKIRGVIPVVKRTSFVAERERVVAEQARFLVEEKRREYADSVVGVLSGELDVLKRDLSDLQLTNRRNKDYTKWVAMHYPNATEVANQRAGSSDFAFKPKISVILPVYNTDPTYLKECIDSVIQQSYVNWELCIVDDASKDELTLATLEKYERKKDPRIHVTHSKKNGHISVSSNLAIETASGDFIALLDHDDILWPNALFEVVKIMQNHQDADFVYSDEDKIEADGYIHYNPFFKPDWSPHLLSCINYITHFSVLRTSLVREVGGFDTHMVGTQDWDLFLRVSEKTDKIFHIPTVLYSWRAHEGSTALSLDSKSYVLINQEAALRNHFTRSKPQYDIEIKRENYNFWYARYALKSKPLVSIIIPTKDKVDYLKRCINSIIDMTNYLNYEIIIIDTGSTEESTKNYFNLLKEQHSDKKLKIKKFNKNPFNYSETCNYGAKQAKGEYFVMLNNDTEIQTRNWIKEMLGYAQQPDIAAVGAKLLYPSGKIQHAGVTVGIGSWEPVAAHPGIAMEDNSKDSIQTPLGMFQLSRQLV